jgi:hypothetical protein
MRQRSGENGIGPADVEDRPAVRVIDLPETALEPVRVSGRLPSPHAGPGRSSQSGLLPDTLRPRRTAETPSPGPTAEESAEPVAKRRRLRRESLLVAAGSLFLAVALLKPWPSSQPARGPATAPTSAPSAEVAIAATPATSAWQSPVGWPGVPQWDYGWPVPDASQAAAGGSPATGDPRWASVDWTALSETDPHDAWGYGAVTMPDLARLPASAATPPPETIWVATGSRRYTTIDVAPGSQVFGLAFTWPHGIEVTSITVGYIDGPGHPANLPPPGFVPFAQVSPLPALPVASPSDVTGGSRKAGPNRGAGTAPAIGSGQYWIPPFATPSASPATIQAAWRSQPWPWPDGIYSVTIATTGGATSYLVTLQPG